MAFKNILRAAQSALKTEQGRAAGRKVVDGLADAGGKAAGGRHASKAEKMRQAAHKYLGPGGGTGR